MERVQQLIIDRIVDIYKDQKKGMSERDAHALRLAIFSTLVVFDNESMLPVTLAVTCDETGTKHINGNLHHQFISAVREDITT